MRVCVQSVLPCSADDAWHEVQKPSLLIHVAWPLVTFQPVSPERLPERWVQGGTVLLHSRLLGIIPFGVRTLYFERVDNKCREIQTRERDALIPRWDHLIRVQSESADATRYLDEIEIEAGIFTLPVYVFAQCFYRHRQRRWKAVARRLGAT